jgi:phospholipase/carboxylesterase
MHRKNLFVHGRPLTAESKVLVMLHGRGASSEDILSLTRYLAVDDFSILAPQATNNSWYPYSFLVSPEKNQPWLDSALSLLSDIFNDLKELKIPSDRLYLLGFSQGACLSLEFAARNAQKFGGVVAFSGGFIGDRLYKENYKGNFANTPVFIGSSDPDPHIPVERVDETAEIYRKMNADTTLRIYKNMGHTVSQDEIDLTNALIFNRVNV